jgi:hypothetical protein
MTAPQPYRERGSGVRAQRAARLGLLAASLVCLVLVASGSSSRSPSAPARDGRGAGAASGSQQGIRFAGRSPSRRLASEAPAPASGSTTVAPPEWPRWYRIPAGAKVVSSSRGLVAALAGPRRDIVLADGRYEWPRPFTDANGSRLYALHLGKAVLSSGLVVGGNFESGGAVVRGIAFDVADPARTYQGGEIETWGRAGANLQVLDCTFEGHGVVPVGLLALNPEGLVARRLVFTHFTDEGIRASNNQTVPYGTPTATIDTISDIVVDRVSRAVPGSSNGTAEAGIFIGQPVENGVSRIRIRSTSWSGIETANNSWNTTFADLDIDVSSRVVSPIGIYLEHFSRNDVITGFEIKGAAIGIAAEWDDGVAGNGGAHGVRIENGTIDATGSLDGVAGVYLDAGTESTTITRVIFKNQSWAAIGTYQNVGSNVIADNRFELQVGAHTVVHGFHIPGVGAEIVR